MKVLSLTCNHCGAPLEVPERTKYVSCQFCQARLAIHVEGNAAYTEVLDQLNARTERIENQLTAIQNQNEIERLDREWEVERQQYLIRNDRGEAREPAQESEFAVSVVLGAAGVVMLVVGASMGASVGLLGLLVLGFAIYAGVAGSANATQYEKAERRYRSRRAALAFQQDSTANWLTRASES